MQISRKKTRRFLLQKLYARIYGNIEEESFHDAFFDGILDFSPDTEYLEEMFSLIIEHESEIIHIIKTYAPKFDIDTMLKTNILAISIAITEMLWYTEEIPAKVSINEAIELVKYFGDDSAKAIVNGILDSFYADIKTYQKSSFNLQEKYHFFTS